MSDNKKYYYLRIKEDFYESDDMKLLQSMDNGYLYSDILMKLYLKSLRADGKLMFKEHIPYNPKMIATITNHNVAIVEKALDTFMKLGLIEVLDNGAIFMLDIQNFIGRGSTEADRKKAYRQRIANEKNALLLEEKTDKCPDKCLKKADKRPPEIEIEIRDRDREIEIELDNSISKDILVPKNLVPIQEAWNSLNLSKVRDIKGNRLKMLNARIKEHGIDGILEAIENVSHSSFLKGQNKTSWTIAFDWFVKPNNFIKVLEGNYEDKGNNKGPSGPSSSMENLKEAYEEALRDEENGNDSANNPFGI